MIMSYCQRTWLNSPCFLIYWFPVFGENFLSVGIREWLFLRQNFSAHLSRFDRSLSLKSQYKRKKFYFSKRETPRQNNSNYFQWSEWKYIGSENNTYKTTHLWCKWNLDRCLTYFMWHALLNCSYSNLCLGGKITENEYILQFFNLLKTFCLTFPCVLAVFVAQAWSSAFLVIP